MQVHERNNEGELKLVGVEPRGMQTVTHTQYGMQYPDGSVVWDSDTDGFPAALVFRELTLDRQAEQAHKRWEDRLKLRAKHVKIDPDQYVNEHTLVKRNVTVIVGELEAH